MRTLRFLATSLALAVIGVAGVTAAVATASVFGHVSLWVIEFAYGWCTGPAIVLAVVAFGLVHGVDALWKRVGARRRLGAPSITHRVVNAVVTRFTSADGAGAATPSSFHTSVRMEPSPPPPLPLVGVLVAVPLAFLNIPGWLAVDQVVRGPVGVVAIFIVPGVVCGLLVGSLAQALRRRATSATLTSAPA